MTGNAPAGQILFYTGFEGLHFGGVTVSAVMSEGYRTGELVIRGLSREHLQSFADWALTLPPDQYARVEQAARAAEEWLLTHDALGYEVETPGRKP